MYPPDFWTRRDWVSKLIVSLLTPAGWFYAASVVLRAKFTRQYRSRAKVVCIGNLTVGGTGKTPIAREIARILIARGAKPVFLTRGYGGKVRGPRLVTSDDLASEVGDEPVMLAKTAPVIVARDRAAGARLAEQSGFDTIIMDDGYQNFALAKDLSLVVVDGELGFANKHVLPAGQLRENVTRGLRRADATIVNGTDLPPELLAARLPLINSRIVPEEQSGWTERRVLAFAGIGRPDKFFSSLSAVGAKIVATRAFPDHHVFTESELEQLRTLARSKDATLVTTEKDSARLSPAERQDILSFPIRIEFIDSVALMHLLDSLVRRALPPQPQ